MDTATRTTLDTWPTTGSASRRTLLPRTLACIIATIALSAGLVTAAWADTPVKATPNPFETTDLPGCYGNLNATINHDSGIQDHGKDSKGPGYYFRDGQTFQEMKDATRDQFCDAA